ncbi:MAG: hypothetical protein LKJ88_08265 [Bacilli bacterium]|jgi:hypothetical protein|nr:hypothetical protein [Bacilli bacterium]
MSKTIVRSLLLAVPLLMNLTSCGKSASAAAKKWRDLVVDIKGVDTEYYINKSLEHNIYMEVYAYDTDSVFFLGSDWVSDSSSNYNSYSYQVRWDVKSGKSYGTYRTGNTALSPEKYADYYVDNPTAKYAKDHAINETGHNYSAALEKDACQRIYTLLKECDAEFVDADIC